MLQEFCVTTGDSPPYAAFLLRTYAKRVILGGVTLVPTRPSPWRRQRKHVYGPAVVDCYVEGKNWTLVRRCLGYRRFDTKGQVTDFRQLGDPPCPVC